MVDHRSTSLPECGLTLEPAPEPGFLTNHIGCVSALYTRLVISLPIIYAVVYKQVMTSFNAVIRHLDIRCSQASLVMDDVCSTTLLID